MSKLKFISAKQSEIQDAQVQSGRIILTSDSCRMYWDFDDITRIEISDIIEIEDDNARLSIENPIDKFYFVRNNHTLWKYQEDEWIAVLTHEIPVATPSTDGKMSAGDKDKLDNIETNANNYIHPSEDGYGHIPAIETSDNNKVLKAGDIPGSASWKYVSFSEIKNTPTTLSEYGITDAASYREVTKNNLDILPVGILAFCTDTKELFIGTSFGNIKILTDLTPLKVDIPALADMKLGNASVADVRV